MGGGDFRETTGRARAIGVAARLRKGSVDLAPLGQRHRLATSRGRETGRGRARKPTSLARATDRKVEPYDLGVTARATVILC